MDSSISQGPATPPLPPAVPVAPVQGAGVTSVSSLISQYTEGTMQLAGLRAQWDGLQNQLYSMRLDNPARAAVQKQTADVGVQIAQLEGNLAVLKAQMGARHVSIRGNPGPAVNIGNVPWFNGRELGNLAGLVILVACAIPMCAFATRRILRGGRAAAPALHADPMAAQRLERLEQAVDSVAIEVERISENQRFMTRVLVERNPAETPASGQQG